MGEFTPSFNFRAHREAKGHPSPDERERGEAILAACADKPVRRILHSADLPTLAPAILSSGKYHARP